MRTSIWFLGVAFLLVGIGSVCLAFAPAASAEDAGKEVAEAAGADVETPTEEAPVDEAKLLAEPSQADQLAFALDNITLFVCAVLVIFMQAGFAMLETGLNSGKNTVNILFKNLMDLSVGVLLFFIIGYGLMYPGEFQLIPGGILGFAGSGIGEMSAPAGPGELYPQVDFLFQVAFAATAATIVSGAVAGRMKFGSYLIYSAIITGLIYPISGAWKWGGGWLDAQGFHDFAGSVVVHAVGGFAGLAGAMVLGPRLGRFVNGKSQPLPGHNLTFAALGVMVLWIGWYGFNPGSNLVFSDGGSAAATMLIAVNTTLAAAAGAVLATIAAWAMFKKPDLTMGLNGALAGLVGITANCDCVSNASAIIIGAIAGVIVVLGVILLDKLRIDDPVGAFPVHGLCGIWGCMAVGIFSLNPEHNWWPQLVGSLVIPAWAFATMFGVFLALRLAGVLRVSADQEQLGLDISEHGMHAYPPSLVSAEGTYGSALSPSKPQMAPAPGVEAKPAVQT